MVEDKVSGEFRFAVPEAAPVGSVLYREHQKLVGKSRFAPFAGYLMPLWFSSISAEHRAVRTTAGLFDCTHMGVLELLSSDATDFLNAAITNNIDSLQIGQGRYSYILDAAGNVLDDIIVYKRDEDKCMVVVNAVNEPKINAYFEGLASGKIIVDIEQPDKVIECRPAIRDMRQFYGGDSRVDIALQGPASRDVLFEIIEDEAIKKDVEELRPFRFAEANIGGIECIVSRTGYTGARLGYELFVSPIKAEEFWQRLLKACENHGAVPCGLGARDSLRIEAGLPLYGHELAGEFGISPFEAGYGWAVKLDKDFFVGKAAMEERVKSYDMKIIRVKLSGKKGVKPVRDGDAVLNEDGACLGWVTSCAKCDRKQIALCFVEKDAAEEGDSVGIYYIARRQSQLAQGRKQKVEKGNVLIADIKGEVVSRFEKF